MTNGKIDWAAKIKEVGDLLTQWVEKKAADRAWREAEEARQAADAPPKPSPDAVLTQRVQQWAEASAVEVRWPHDFAPDLTAGASPDDLRFKHRVEDSPCIDWGRLTAKIPRFTLRPTTPDQLAEALRLLRDVSLPFKVRGGGYSNGAQTLIDSGGVVIDIKGLAAIVDDDPAHDIIRVQGGARWIDVIRHLHRQGRRPTTLIGNWNATISGTLSVGGFGDATHLRGPVVASVQAMTVMTLDGQRHSVQPGDPLFDYTLAGRGQVAVILDATFATRRDPWVVNAALLAWSNVEDFITDAALIADEARFSPFNVRYYWRGDTPFLGGACLPTDASDIDDRLRGLKARCVGVRPAEDLFDVGVEMSDLGFGSQRCWPCLEFVLPLPDGLSTWHAIHDDIRACLLDLALEDGSPIVVMRPPQGIPLAPFPTSERCLVCAIRPSLQGFQAPLNTSFLHKWRGRILDAGGKIYLMSIEPDGDLKLDKQFGPDALATLRSLKATHDPQGLLNPGLLR
jgi:hypothetical protein